MDISTKEGRAKLQMLHRLASLQDASSDSAGFEWNCAAIDHMPAALRLLDERDAEIEKLKNAARGEATVLHTEIERLRKQLREAEREARDAARDAAAQARHEERYPDKPYGTY